MHSLFISGFADLEELSVSSLRKSYTNLRRLFFEDRYGKYIRTLGDLPFCRRREWNAIRDSTYNQSWNHFDYIPSTAPFIEMLGLKCTVGTLCMPVYDRDFDCALSVYEALRICSLHITTTATAEFLTWYASCVADLSWRASNAAILRAAKVTKVRIDIRSKDDFRNSRKRLEAELEEEVSDFHG